MRPSTYFFLLAACAASFLLNGSASSEPHYSEDSDFHPRARYPAFKEQHPRLCFDEGHFNLSVRRGRYKPVQELLASDGIDVFPTVKKFTRLFLKSCDLLYVSAALGDPDISHRTASRSAFTRSEIKAIHAWVKNGGGLLLTTDHRPMADAMEPLLNEFGIEGSLINVRNSKKPIPPFVEPGIFEISGDQIRAESPIIKGVSIDDQIRTVFFFYGEAFKVARGSDPFLLAGKQSEIQSDDEKRDPLVYPAVALALHVGKGRVVTIGDGTVFTSKFDQSIGEKTGINRPGSDNVQLALNIFRWLGKL